MTGVNLVRGFESLPLRQRLTTRSELALPWRRDADAGSVATSEMEFGILGPLEVRSEQGDVAVAGGKPAAVLAVLLLHANEPVSADKLAIALWGEDAQDGASKAVQVNVSRLRKALGDPEIVKTTPAGYRLAIEPGQLDAARFEELVKHGRRTLRNGEAAQASEVLRQALFFETGDLDLGEGLEGEVGERGSTP